MQSVALSELKVGDRVLVRHGTTTRLDHVSKITPKGFIVVNAATYKPKNGVMRGWTSAWEPAPRIMPFDPEMWARVIQHRESDKRKQFVQDAIHAGKLSDEVYVELYAVLVKRNLVPSEKESQ